jgi:Ca2+-binding RTX toxin-like protein
MTKITGTNKSETLSGGAGDDFINGASGDDVLNGGGGNDTLFDSDEYASDDDAPTDADKLYGGAGNDVLTHYQGFSYSGTVQNTDGDLLDGGAGDDRLLFFGGQKGCTAVGGDGIDTLMFTLHGTLPNGAEFSMPTDMELVGSNVSVTLYTGGPRGTNPSLQVSGTGIERVQFASGAGDDKLVGGNLDDTLESYGGRDEIHGNGGNDYITIDLIEYAGNAPTNVMIDGGANTDTFDFSSYIASDENFVLDLSAGTFTANGRSLGPITGFESLTAWTRDGDDRLTGGALADHLRADNGNNKLVGNGGNDVLTSGDGVDSLDGGEGNDALYAGFGKDSLTGGGGNDLLDGGAGNDVMNGGAGNDTYAVDYLYDYRVDQTKAPRDIIYDTSGIDNITTQMSYLDMRFYKDIENATLDGITSVNVIGNDLNNTIDGRYAYFGLKADGGLGSDSILGALKSSNTLSGGVGNDVIDGGIYSDTLDGGADKDTLSGGDGNDVVKGGDGDDVILGDAPQNNAGVVFGSGNITKASGQGDAAHPISLDGHFSLAANPEIDNAKSLPHVTVSAKLNYVDYYNNSDFYTISLKAGAAIVVDIDTNSTDEFDATVLILNAEGEQLADSSYGSAREKSTGSPNANDPFLTYVAPSDGLYTIKVRPDFSGEGGSAYRMHVSLGQLGGDDTLSGQAGNDIIYGGEGQDSLDGGAGTDTLSGGAGSDTYYVDNSGDRCVEANGVAGTDLVLASVSYSLGGSELENLSLTGTTNLNGTGNSIANVITGNSGNNVLNGLGGADTMIGGVGSDTYYVDNVRDKAVEANGAAGTDLVYASASFSLAASELENLTLTGNASINGTGNSIANVVKGNTGANALDGMAGNDTLIGLAGKDTFVFSTALGAANVDHLTDFSAVDDTIQLSKSIFTALSAGALAATAFKDLSVAGAKVDADDRILYSKTTGALSYDADGNGSKAAVQFAIIDTKVALTHADFLVV